MFTYISWSILSQYGFNDNDVTNSLVLILITLRTNTIPISVQNFVSWIQSSSTDSIDFDKSITSSLDIIVIFNIIIELLNFPEVSFFFFSQKSL